MKTMKKWLPILLCVIMVVAVCAVAVYAAGDETNIYAEYRAGESGTTVLDISKTNLKAGDTFRIRLGVNKMTVSSTAFGFDFDANMFELVKYTAPSIEYTETRLEYDEETEEEKKVTVTVKKEATSVSTIEEANRDGHFGVVFAGTQEITYAQKLVTVITLRVKDNASGNTTITYFEDSAGADGCKNDAAVTQTVTIAAAHTCGGEELTLHNEVPASCTVNGVKAYYACSCGKYYEDEACAKEIADLEAWKQGDGKIPAGHIYGELIPATEAVHSATELKAPVAAHYFCHECDTYFTESKEETTLEALTGEMPVHTGTKYNSIGDGKHSISCACGAVVTGSENCSGGEANCTEAAICQHCKAAYGTENGHSFQRGIKGEELSAGNCSVAATYATKCDHCDFEDSSKVITGNKVPAVHASNNVKYENITATTHDVYYACCGALKQAGVAHEYNNHICDCDHVEHFELLVQDMTSEVTFSVPYGTNILDFLNAKVEAGEISIDRHYVDDSDSKGFEDFIEWEKWDDIPNIDEDTVVTGKMTVYAAVTFTGWEIGYEELGWSYCVEGNFVEGWYEIEDAWYFFVIVEENGWNYYVTGLTRVPYNTALGHKNNETSTTYKDATEAWYFFDAAGKYESAKNGIIDGKYVVNGMIPWHPGFVTVESQLYYFVGDKDNGGNKLANGAVYITRLNDVEGFKSGYIMFRDGKVDTTYTGTAEIKENLFYFQNGICLTGVGMMETADGLIFVRSGGQLAVGDYWVTAAKANGFVEGDKLYKFSEDGILTINPEKNGIVDGVYYKEGIPYYAGLIEIDGDYYYVKSNGEVATGWYYVTKTNGIDFGTTKLFFGEDGKMQEVKNGILEGEDGKLYYYVNNRIIGAGLIKIGEDYYYVKTSTGEVVTGTYYITVTNGLEGFAAGQKCVFDKTGKLVK